MRTHSKVCLGGSEEVLHFETERVILLVYNNRLLLGQKSVSFVAHVLIRLYLWGEGVTV